MHGYQVSVWILEDEGRAERPIEGLLNNYCASGGDGGVKRYGLGIV